MKVKRSVNPNRRARDDACFTSKLHHRLRAVDGFNCLSVGRSCTFEQYLSLLVHVGRYQSLLAWFRKNYHRVRRGTGGPTAQEAGPSRSSGARRDPRPPDDADDAVHPPQGEPEGRQPRRRHPKRTPPAGGVPVLVGLAIAVALRSPPHLLRPRNPIPGVRPGVAPVSDLGIRLRRGRPQRRWSRCGSGCRRPRVQAPLRALRVPFGRSAHGPVPRAEEGLSRKALEGVLLRPHRGAPGQDWTGEESPQEGEGQGGRRGGGVEA